VHTNYENNLRRLEVMTISKKIVLGTILTVLSSSLVFANGTAEKKVTPAANTGRSGTITVVGVR